VRRTVRGLLIGVACVAVIVLFVLPGRTLLQQRDTLARTRHQIQVLDNENAKLAATARSLQSDGEIERLARQRYGLVMPGQQAYVVLPPAAGVPAGRTPSTTVPPGN
jgi:cell division protein FtsB